VNKNKGNKLRSEGDYCLLEHNAVLTGNVTGISKK